MADKLPPLPKGLTIVDDKLPPLPKGLTVVEEKKNRIQNAPPTGTQTSKSGSLPFLPQVSTKAPSVLLSDAQKQQREKERIGKRFETTLLNIPTEFGRVTPFMKAAKQIQETLPEAPSFRKYGEIPRMQPTAMTEGQLLGESLTKGTDFQELTTDKFTEKKTGLQKQIENAENAFRAYQGDELANQVQSYIPPEETLKIKKELGFDEKMSNVGSNFVNRLERFAPNTALAVGQTLTTLLGEDYGGEAYRMITGGVGNAEIHRMEAFDKLAKLDAEYKYSKGLIQSVQDLDLGGVAAGITDAVGSLVSTIITSAPTAGLGLYSDMVGSGLYNYNSAKANRLGITVDELYDSSQNEFFVPAILGGVGAQLEKIGLKGIKTAIMSNMAKGAGQKFALIGHNMNKEGITELLQTGLEEVSNTLAQGKSVAEATLEFGKTLFSKKGAESYLMGVVASGSAIGGGRILKGLFSDKSKKKASQAIQAIEQQQQELSNPDLTEESRVFVLENIKNNVAELVDAVDSDVNETDGLSEDQKREVNNLNTKIQAFEVVINDPAASEETKNRAAKVSKETQAKIDDIINKKPPIVPPATGGAMAEAEPIAKPTFDTEEQLIEEGKTAEEEYKKTGDQVTYEQKIKELEEREKNLVPVPEDAEIGKPEELEPIRQLGTGANVYFETEKYRVNDTLKNGKVLLNIQSQTSEIPIANIEFDNANDAVIIAQELNNKFPDGVPDAILIDKYIEQLKNDLLVTKPQTDAIQVEAAGQVPVLTEATVGEEVEQGKPQPEAEVVTEEGFKAEEIKKAINDLQKAKSVKYWMEPIFSSESIGQPKNYEPNGFTYDMVDTSEGKATIINTYDAEGKIAATMSILDVPSKDSPKGAFKISTREDVKKQGYASRLLDEASRMGYDIPALIKNNSFSSSGRDLLGSWLNNKLKTTTKEQTPAQQVKQLRAEEQAELNAAIPNADQYLTDGKVDRAKITDAKDLEAFDKIYDKYDKLITPLLPKKKAPAKAEPKLKSKVATRLLFKKAVDLFYDISGTEGSAKKRTISAKRRTFMEQNPSIKYIDDNWPNISKQLKAKGLLEKSKGCP